MPILKHMGEELLVRTNNICIYGEIRKISIDCDWRKCLIKSYGMSEMIWLNGKHHYAPNFNEVGGAYCFWDVCVCIHPSVTLLMHSITSELCMLGFWISYMDSSWKNSWHVFFSHYAPFLSYGPLKKYGLVALLLDVPPSIHPCVRPLRFWCIA